MEPMKKEYDSDNVCSGCLSMDRRLSSENELISLFWDLLGVHSQPIADDTRYAKLCWECMAVLKRLKLFQRQIQQAQTVLLQNVYQGEPNYTTLSRLSQTTKNDFDKEIRHINNRKKIKKLQDSEISNSKSKEVKSEEEEILESDIFIKKESNDDFVDTAYEITDEQIKETVPEHDKATEDLNQKYKIDDSIKSDNESMNIDNIETDLEIDTLETNETEPKKAKKDKNYCKLVVKKYLKHAKVKRSNKIEFDSLKEYFDEVFLSEAEYDIFLKRDSKILRTYPCSECSRAYRRELDLRRHFAVNHCKETGPYVCTECNEDIGSKSKLVEHWRLHTKMFKCKMCSHHVRDRVGEMKKHLNRSHTLLFTCLVCGQRFGQARTFSEHYQEDHVKLTCDYCNKKFFEKRILERHLRLNHTSPYCKLCNRIFASHTILRTHSKEVHPELHPDNKVRKEDTYCVECDKQYDSVMKYRRHLNESNKHRSVPQKSVSCKVCGKVFVKAKYMNNHYRVFHAGGSKHYCEKCDKSFVTAFTLRTHNKRVHEKQVPPKTKVCDLCGRAFSTNRILYNHRRTHTGERPFQCPHCPAAFTQKHAMKAHQKSQHKNKMDTEVFKTT